MLAGWRACEEVRLELLELRPRAGPSKSSDTVCTVQISKHGIKSFLTFEFENFEIFSV